MKIDRHGRAKILTQPEIQLLFSRGLHKLTAIAPYSASACTLPFPLFRFWFWFWFGQLRSLWLWWSRMRFSTCDIKNPTKGIVLSSHSSSSDLLIIPPGNTSVSVFHFTNETSQSGCFCSKQTDEPVLNKGNPCSSRALPFPRLSG